MGGTLKDICQQIKTLFVSFANVPISIEYEPLIEESKRILSSHISGPYSPKGLDLFIQGCSYVYKIKTQGVSLMVVGSDHVDHVFLTHCKKIIRRVAVIKEWCKLNSDFVIWLVPTSWPRLLPEQGQQVTPENINGGFTYVTGSSSTAANNIFVYRKEECAKVILHEVLHHSKMHVSSWDDESLRKLYAALHVSQESCLPISMQTCSTRLEPNEAIVELWAEIMQMAFVHIEYGVPIKTLLDKECQYNRSKTFQLLKHYAGLPDQIWKEKTHALSYNVIRGILLTHLDAWLDMPYPYDSRVVTDFILQHIESYIGQVMVHKDAYVSSTNRRLAKSLRMTALISDF